jgi:hypothetical protein
MATFADDTAVMALEETVESLIRKLQSAVNKVTVWTKKMVNKTQLVVY